MKALLTAAVLVLAMPAFAQQPQCAPRHELVKVLQNKYGEVRRSIGLGANNNIVEVFSNMETGTWTIVAVRVDSTACIVASGEMYSEFGDAPNVAAPVVEGEPA